MMPANFFGAPYRQLFIDFDAYTDGDSEFKKELIELMIDNLNELKSTLYNAAEKNDAPLFHRVCHKVKATLHMLEDRELLDTIDGLKVMINDPVRIEMLNKICVEMIESLRKHQ